MKTRSLFILMLSLFAAALTCVMAGSCIADDAAVGQSSDKDAAAGLLQEAESLLAQCAAPSALEKLDQLLTKYPASSSVPRSRFRKVVALLFLGRNEESISLARELVQEYKGTENEIYAAWAQCHIGINYKALKDWENALLELKKVRSEFGGIPDKGPLTLAQEQLGLFKAPDAVAAYEALIEKYPDSPDLGAWYAGLADVYRSMDKYAECIPVLDKAIELATDPEVKKRCKIERARCYLKLDRIDDALAKYEELEREYPNDPERASWYCKIAFYYRGKKGYANAAAWFEKCAKAETDINARERNMYRAASALFEKGDYEEAKTICKELMASADPKMVVDAYWKTVQCLRMQGKHDEALTLLDNMYETHNNPFLRSTALCVKSEYLIYTLKNYGQAIPVLKRCISEYPNEMETKITAKELLPWALDKAGRVDEAVEAVKAMAAEDDVAEDEAERLIRIGEIYFRNRRYRDVVRTLKEATALVGGGREQVARAKYLLGLCYREWGDTVSARYYMTQVAAEFPDMEYGKFAKQALRSWPEPEPAP